MGCDAVFTKEMVGAERSGEFWISTLLSDKLCRVNTANVGGSYLLDSPFGVHVVKAGSEDAIEYRAEGHYGQLLMILGEAGVSATTPVTTASGRVGTVADLYRDALMRFSLNQELEFIACALAYWNTPARTWKDQFDNEHSFDELVSQIISQPFGQGSCGGCHAPYALVTILRIDEDYHILSDNLRENVKIWLTKLARILETRYSESGGWDRTWAEKDRLNYVMGDTLLDRITITGHHLEWIAACPQGI